MKELLFRHALHYRRRAGHPVVTRFHRPYRRRTDSPASRHRHHRADLQFYLGPAVGGRTDGRRHRAVVCFRFRRSLGLFPGLKLSTGDTISGPEDSRAELAGPEFARGRHRLVGCVLENGDARLGQPGYNKCWTRN